MTAIVTASTASAQVQTKDQRKCTAAMNKSLAKVSGVVAKETLRCVGERLDGSLAATIGDCLAADADGKVEKARTKTETLFAKRCTGTSKKEPMLPRLPPYGVSDADAVNDAGTDFQLALLRDALGDDLETLLDAASGEKNSAKCVETVAKRLAKCQSVYLKEFFKCKNTGLKDETAPFDGPEDLAACLGDDPKEKIAKTCDLREEVKPGKFKLDGLRKALVKNCEAKGVAIDGVLPGCVTSDPETAHACLHAAIRCRACLAAKHADGLALDCDVFDDGASNASCLFIGEHQCTIDPETSGFLFDTSAFFDIFPLSGAIDVDCGEVDPATGRAPCTCGVSSIPPVPIVPNLGVACVNPAAGCAAGEISCNGGDDFDGFMTSMHNIGACTGNSDCLTQCQSTCATNGAAVFDSGCEGFCRDGTNDGLACTDDAGCPDGTCNGVDNLGHGNVCQCECLDDSGTPALPGALRCNLGVDIDVELAEPCGDGDVLFSIGPRCVPFTTETASGTIADANNVSGAQLPAGQEIFVGLPLACPDLTTNGTSGLSLVSAVNALDVDLAGDIAFHFLLNCQ